MKNESYQLVPFPRIRRLMVDGGRLGRQKHLIHGLVEIDITDARRMLREHRKSTGEAISLTAFLIRCLGRAVDEHRSLHAYRTWGGKLVIHKDVDVNTMFEVEVDGCKVIRPHIIRAANRKSAKEIHDEIRDFQMNHANGREAKFVERIVLLPGFIRRGFLRYLLKHPRMSKEMNGTVSLTAVGMFGMGAGWGIPVTNHTLQITLGGISEKPVLVDGRLENRKNLCVTITLDHDIVDGAPAARFIHTLKKLVENTGGMD